MSAPGAKEINPPAAKDTAHDKKHPLSWTLSTVVFTNVILACLVGVALFRFGSVGSALSCLRGDRLLANSHVKSLGTIQKGQEREVNFELTNAGNRPVKIFGGTSTCTCMLATGMPAIIQPEDHLTIGIKFRAKGKPGPTRERLRLFVDHPNQRHLDLVIECRIVQSDNRALTDASFRSTQ